MSEIVEARPAQEKRLAVMQIQVAQMQVTKRLGTVQTGARMKVLPATVVPRADLVSRQTDLEREWAERPEVKICQAIEDDLRFLMVELGC
jgi:hypothetical protein